MKQRNKRQINSHLSKLPRNRKDLGKWLITLVILVVAGGLGVGTDFFASDSTSTSPTTQETRVNESDRTAIDQFDGSNLDSLPEMVKIPVTYTRVVDGDTLMVELNGYSLRVRHLMIDTPESVKEGMSVQPFGKEASDRNDELLKSAKQVYLMLDVGPPADQYDRVLAYIYADDVLVAEQLLEEGFATVRFVNPPNNSYEARFRDAQEAAKQAGLNIWSIDDYVEANGYFNQVNN